MTVNSVTGSFQITRSLFQQPARTVLGGGVRSAGLAKFERALSLTILLRALLWVLISIPVAIAVDIVISSGNPVGRDFTPHGAR